MSLMMLHPVIELGYTESDGCCISYTISMEVLVIHTTPGNVGGPSHTLKATSQIQYRSCCTLLMAPKSLHSLCSHLILVLPPLN